MVFEELADRWVMRTLRVGDRVQHRFPLTFHDDYGGEHDLRAAYAPTVALLEWLHRGPRIAGHLPSEPREELDAVVLERAFAPRTIDGAEPSLRIDALAIVAAAADALIAAGVADVHDALHARNVLVFEHGVALVDLLHTRLTRTVPSPRPADVGSTLRAVLIDGATETARCVVALSLTWAELRRGRPLFFEGASLHETLRAAIDAKARLAAAPLVDEAMGERERDVVRTALTDPARFPTCSELVRALR